MKITLKVITRVQGVHCWPNATKNREYLRSSHRHRFTIVVHVRVTETDRQIEFHDIQDHTLKIIKDMASPKSRNTPLLDFRDSSCELICCFILSELPVACAVEVWEDDECGAIVEREEKRHDEDGD